MKKYIYLLLIVLFSGIHVAFAQKTGGTFSGSFETNSAYYVSDPKSGQTPLSENSDKFGSNNYLKLDYVNSKVSVGVQLEGYYPAFSGWDPRLKGTGLMNKYVSFTDKKFQVTAGDFYDQFGNGLIFRAFEDRALGLNTSIEGARAIYNTRGFSIKAIWGRQRSFMDYSDGYVRGMDASFSLSEVFKIPVDLFDIEAGVVSRYAKTTTDANPANVNAFSGRLNFSHGGFVLRSEYAYKTPSNISFKGVLPGSALLIDLGYSSEGFGVQLIGRRLENMGYYMNEVDKLGSPVNYLPALTLQNNYALGLINPYLTSVDGEIGGQLDIYYNIPTGRNKLKVHFNASQYNKIGEKPDGTGTEFFGFGGLLWQEFNLSLQRNFGKQFKLLVMAGQQKFNPVVGGKGDDEYTQIFGVIDATYKINRKHALRLELQHLWSKEYKGNWAYATIEYTFAPKWSIYASDMYNYGAAWVSTQTETANGGVETTTDYVRNNTHYYNVGFSFSHNRTRFALSYGRNRDGVTCSGGVCRVQPAYTGLNFVLTSSF